MAKQQSMLLRSPWYTAPNAQTPAYEWALSDPNPPIGAWAALRIFQIERNEKGFGDRLPRSASADSSSSTAGGPTAMTAPATTCLRVASSVSTTSASIAATLPDGSRIGGAMAPPGWRPSASIFCK